MFVRSFPCSNELYTHVVYGKTLSEEYLHSLSISIVIPIEYKLHAYESV